MKPYEPAFRVGTIVRIRPRHELEDFKEKWKYHNPLTLEQLEFAGVTTAVVEIGFYHGGDVLYRLDGVPGIWHEQCLLGDPEQA